VPAVITSPQNGKPHAGTPTNVHYDVGPLPAGMNALNQDVKKTGKKLEPVPAVITSTGSDGKQHAGTPTNVRNDVGPLPAGGSMA